MNRDLVILIVVLCGLGYAFLLFMFWAIVKVGARADRWTDELLSKKEAEYLRRKDE